MIESLYTTAVTASRPSVLEVNHRFARNLPTGSGEEANIASVPSEKILSGLKLGLDSLTSTGAFHGGKVKFL